MQTGVKGPGRLTPALRGACLQVPTLAAGQQLPTSQSAAVYRRLGTSSPVEVSLRQYCQALKRRMHSHVAVAAAAGSGPGPGPGGAAGAGSAGGGGGRAAAYSLARRRGPEPWMVVSAVCAVCLLLCNFHRSVFTALLPALAGAGGGGLALSGGEVGLLQGAMLVGYLAGQLPAGEASDREGGDRVLLRSLALWSLATAATATAAGAPASFPASLPLHALPGCSWLSPALLLLLAARCAMGLFSACIMPAVSAMAAQWVPRERKAGTLAMVYAFFNMGGVLGLVAAPLLAARSGWPAAFVTAAAGGAMWAALGSAAVARAGPRPPLPSQQQEQQQQQPRGGSPGGAVPSKPWWRTLPRETAVQVAALCWVHGVIGWGFFTLQAWLPLFFRSLGVDSLAGAGLLSALPWLAAAVTGTLAGGLADRMVRGGTLGAGPAGRLAVRRAMHAVSSLGCGAAMAALAAGTAQGGGMAPAAAAACLVAAVGCYGFSFGGFHAYVQDVAPSDAGKLLGLTNTASVVGGIAGNLATGAMLEAFGSYSGTFWAAAALYVSSWAVFVGVLRGDPVRLAPAGGGGGDSNGP